MPDKDSILPVQQSRFHFDNMHWKDPMQYGRILLYQVGDLCCESGYTTRPHEQFCYEISYIVSGKAVFSTDGRRHNVKKGDVYLNRPGEVHDVVSDKMDPVRYFYAAFGLADRRSCIDGLDGALAKFDTIRNPVTSGKSDLYMPFVSIFNELINSLEHSDSLIECCLIQMILLASRNYGGDGTAVYSPKLLMEHSKKIVYEVVNYIDANFCRITDLVELCETFDYSYSYLSHIFSHEIGMSIQEYHDNKRFEAAARWLSEGTLSVTEIAERLQYQSIHSFSRAFKRHFGCSPTKYDK